MRIRSVSAIWRNPLGSCLPRVTLYGYPVFLMRHCTAIGYGHTAGLWPVTGAYSVVTLSD
jgi:hypothetical protein